MKKLLFLLLLLPAFLFGQDFTIDKGSGIMYFSDVPGTTPQVSSGSEFGYNTSTRDLYVWNRTTMAWIPFNFATADSGVPSGDPGGGNKLYVDQDTGDLYKWSGSQWELILSRNNKVYVFTSPADTTTAPNAIEGDLGVVADSILMIKDSLTWIQFNGGSGSGGSGSSIYTTSDSTAAGLVVSVRDSVKWKGDMIVEGDDTAPNIKLRPGSGQTEKLIEWVDENNNVLGGVNPNGSVVLFDSLFYFNPIDSTFKIGNFEFDLTQDTAGLDGKVFTYDSSDQKVRLDIFPGFYDADGTITSNRTVTFENSRLFYANDNGDLSGTVYVNGDGNPNWVFFNQVRDATLPSSVFLDGVSFNGINTNNGSGTILISGGSFFSESSSKGGTIVLDGAGGGDLGNEKRNPNQGGINMYAGPNVDDWPEIALSLFGDGSLAGRDSLFQFEMVDTTLRAGNLEFDGSSSTSGLDGQPLIFDSVSGKIAVKQKFIETSTVQNFPSIAAHSANTITVTVTGAEIGDRVIVTEDISTVATAIYRGIVPSADNVEIQAWNPRTTAQDPPSGTFYITVIKPD